MAHFAEIENNITTSPDEKVLEGTVIVPFVEQSNANGTITVPSSTFSSGDVVTIFNNTNTSLTITCSALTSFAAGNNVTKSSVNVTTRGVASVMFINSSVCVITGALSGA